MPTLVQICIVVATLALVAAVAATIFALVRLGRAVARLTSAAEVSIGQIERIVLETQELLAAARVVMPAALVVTNRLQRLAERVADVSTAVLDEVETPVFTAVAVARGMKRGGLRLLDLFTRRLAGQRSDGSAT